MSAALVWRGLVSSGPAEARERLLGFWRDIEARGPIDRWVASWGVWLERAPVIINATPYLGQLLAEPQLRRTLRAHLDLDGLTKSEARRARPKLFIGSTDVLNGDRVVFQGEAVGYEHIIASAAVPPLFRAVHAEDRLLWDGLFTTNPPIREFTDLDEPPDEVWVVQINPQRREREPRSLWEVKDRSNELSGNLSLGQELFFISKINQLREEHPSLASRYAQIRIRVVELEASRLDLPSKLDRRPEFIEALINAGSERADSFFEERSLWPRQGTAPAGAVLMCGGGAAPAPTNGRAARDRAHYDS